MFWNLPVSIPMIRFLLGNSDWHKIPSPISELLILKNHSLGFYLYQDMALDISTACNRFIFLHVLPRLFSLFHRLPFSFSPTVPSELQHEHVLEPTVNKQKRDQLKIISSLFHEHFKREYSLITHLPFSHYCERRTPLTKSPHKYNNWSYRLK